MTVRRTWLFAIAGAILLLFVAGYIFLYVTMVTIRNHSAVALTDMTCAINGRSLCPVFVAPGETRRAYAVLRTEDAMVFSFRADGSEKQAIIGYPIPMPADSYGITVAPDMKVSEEFYRRW